MVSRVAFLNCSFLFGMCKVLILLELLFVFTNGQNADETWYTFRDYEYIFPYGFERGYLKVKQRCDDLGATLVDVKSTAIKDFLVAHLGTIRTAPYSYYIGLKRIGITDDDFQWTDGTSVASGETFWANGEPNAAIERYVIMGWIYAPDSSFPWYDVDGTRPSRISCQKAVITTENPPGQAYTTTTSPSTTTRATITTTPTVQTTTTTRPIIDTTATSKTATAIGVGSTTTSTLIPMSPTTTKRTQPRTTSTQPPAPSVGGAVTPMSSGAASNGAIITRGPSGLSTTKDGVTDQNLDAFNEEQATNDTALSLSELKAATEESADDVRARILMIIGIISGSTTFIVLSIVMLFFYSRWKRRLVKKKTKIITLPDIYDDGGNAKAKRMSRVKKQAKPDDETEAEPDDENADKPDFALDFDVGVFLGGPMARHFSLQPDSSDSTFIEAKETLSPSFLKRRMSSWYENAVSFLHLHGANRNSQDTSYSGNRGGLVDEETPPGPEEANMDPEPSSGADESDVEEEDIAPEPDNEVVLES